MAKRDELRVDMWVICKKKSTYPETFGHFLQEKPLGVAQIKYLDGRFGALNVGIGNKTNTSGTWAFMPDDLEIIK